jgi:hypothetical protein
VSVGVQRYSVQCKGYNLVGVTTVEEDATRGTTILVYLQLHIFFFLLYMFISFSILKAVQHITTMARKNKTRHYSASQYNGYIQKLTIQKLTN